MKDMHPAVVASLILACALILSSVLFRLLPRYELSQVHPTIALDKWTGELTTYDSHLDSRRLKP
jgi:hypothetical protein